MEMAEIMKLATDRLHDLKALHAEAMMNEDDEVKRWRIVEEYVRTCRKIEEIEGITWH